MSIHDHMVDENENKIRVIAWDIYGKATEWMDRYLRHDECECLITAIEEKDAKISIVQACSVQGWDYILVFVVDQMQQVAFDLLNQLGVPLEKIIFPLDTADSMTRHQQISERIFSEEFTRSDQFRMMCESGDYVVCTTDGLSYLGSSTDRVIMKYMFQVGENWAKDEIHRYFELAEKHFHNHLKRDNLYFCDIGANIGTTCIYVKKKMYPSMRVLAVEPVPLTYRMLKINAILNGVSEDECILSNVGVSDVAGEMTMNYDPRNPGGSSLTVDYGRSELVKVKTVPFDDYLNQVGVRPEEIGCFWIDIEGFECEFMEGASKTLSEVSVPTVMEFTPQFLIEHDRYERFMELVSKFWNSYIILQEDDTVHSIDTLRSYENVQFDLFLLNC